MAHPTPHTHPLFRPDTLWPIALAVLAASLRLWHINHGLPELSEEAIIFRKALELWGPGGRGGDLNPHLFVYPTLTIYIHFFLQQAHCLLGGFSRPADYLLGFLIDPTVPVLIARGVGVVADVITVLFVGRIACRFGGLAAVTSMAIAACAPSMILTSRLIYNDPVMCALSLVAIDRVVSYAELGGRARLVLAATLIGLASGAKYPAVLLMGPLGLAVWHRERGLAMLRAVATGGLFTAIAFLITTPYVLVSWPEFVRDALLHRDVTLGGGLGKLTGTGLPYYIVGLRQNLGWFGLAFLAVSAVCVLMRFRTLPLVLLWACWAIFFLPIALARVEAERYLLPVIAISSALVGAGVSCLLPLVPTAFRRIATAGVLALLLTPVLWAGVGAGVSGQSSTELEARRWFERHAGSGDLILSEAYGPTLLSPGQRATVRSDEVFAAASPGMQERYLAQPVFHFVWLPLVVGGHMGVRLGPDGADEVPVYAHVVDWNAAVYDIRLLAGVDYVVTTSAVRGRFEQDSSRFPEQHRFYAFLDQLAEKTAAFESGRTIEGPRIAIYRIGSAARKAILATGQLDSLWWARTVPDEFQAAASLAAGPSLVAPTDSALTLPVWAHTLSTAYAERYAGFADDLAENLTDLGRYDYAAPLGQATLRVLPADKRALYLFVQSAGRLGRWADARQAIESSMAVFRRQGGVPADVVFLEAGVLLRTGAQDEARTLLIGLLHSDDMEIATAASQALKRLTPLPPQ